LGIFGVKLMMRILFLVAMLFAAIGTEQSALAASTPSTALTARCESCHGDQGGSKPDAARLNGLSSDYLFARLKAFANPIDQSPHAIDNMWSVIINMSDNDKRQLADYFANQAAPAAKLNGPVLGRNLYEQGIPAQGVAACQSCHGPRGDGQGAVPRLAGQKQEYLKMQLWAFNLVAREHGAMNSGAMKLSSDQIDALSAYLAGS
jgi:cytochrome c553